MYKPPPARPPERPKKFGVIVLDDDSCGFFYAGLDNTLSQLAACDPHQFTGAAPLDLVRNCLESDPLAKAVGLGVLNALSQHLLSVSGFRLDRTGDPMGHLDLAGAQHVGMVGFFPPLVAALAGGYGEVLYRTQSVSGYSPADGRFLTDSPASPAPVSVRRRDIIR